MNLSIDFARWRSDVPSGGNRYDEELTSSLRGLGAQVHEHPVSGSWPFPSPDERERFRAVLAAGSQGGSTRWLIGNIVAAAVPEMIRATVEAGQSVAIVMHYFAADERGISPAMRSHIAASEAAAVKAASRVIATSEWTAHEVSKRYGREDVVVALPGVAPAQVSLGSVTNGNPPTLLWLGGLTPTKDPSTFVAALAELRDLDWRARIVGPDTIDPDVSRRVRAEIDRAGLSQRVEVLGALEGAALQSVWSHTDLLVHTSHAETYGMVVSEALARGIPSIVPTGTGAVEAQQGAGGQFVPGDHGDLARMLRKWLTHPGLQDQWRSEAAKQRTTLPTWEGTARTVAHALES